MKPQLIAVAVLLLIISLVGAYYSGKNIGEAEEQASNAVVATKIAVETAEKLRKSQQANDQIANAWYETTLSTSEKTNELQQEINRLIVKTKTVQSRGDNVACTCMPIAPDNFDERLRVLTAASDCESLGTSTNKPIVISDSDGLYGYSIGLASDRCRIAEQLKSLILTIRE